MSDAPIENVVVEGGKKCPAGKVKDAQSGRCRKRKCGRGRTRSGSGRCHRIKSRRMHGGEEVAPVEGGAQGRRQMQGGEQAVLTAGALEEAFQAGLEAGARRKSRKSGRKSRKSARKSRRSHKGRKHARGGEVAPAEPVAVQGGSIQGGEVEAPVQA